MIALRLATAADASDISAIYASYVSASAISFEAEPPTTVEMSARIDAVLAALPWFVCVQGDEILGYAYASKHKDRAAYRWSVDTTVYVRSDCHRRNIGCALCTALLEVLRLQGFCAAHAGISLPNAGSVALHESLGFRSVAVYPKVGWKLGAWHDVGVWQLALRAREGAPEEPLSLERVQRDPRFLAALAAGASLVRG